MLIREEMRRVFAISALLLIILMRSSAASKADQHLCQQRDHQVAAALQLYARKSASSGDIMDVSTMFAPRVGADQVNPQSIRPEDLQEWKRALEEQVQAGTRAL